MDSNINYIFSGFQGAQIRQFVVDFWAYTGPILVNFRIYVQGVANIHSQLKFHCL